MARELSEQEKREKLKAMINGSKSAFMVTLASDGRMHGRPMQMAESTDLDELWFSSQRDTAKIDELEQNDRIFLGFCNASGSEWVSLNGRATIVDDLATKREKWSPVWKNWFEGPEDPRQVLIRVEPESAEYWDGGSQIVSLVKMAFTAVTGVKTSDGENERVRL